MTQSRNTLTRGAELFKLEKRIIVFWIRDWGNSSVSKDYFLRSSNKTSFSLNAIDKKLKSHGMLSQGQRDGCYWSAPRRLINLGAVRGRKRYISTRNRHRFFYSSKRLYKKKTSKLRLQKDLRKLSRHRTKVRFIPSSNNGRFGRQEHQIICYRHLSPRRSR